MASSEYFSTYVSLEPSGRNTMLSPKKTGRGPGDNTQEFIFDIGKCTWTTPDHKTVDAVCKSVSGGIQEKGSQGDGIYPVTGRQIIKTISCAFDYPSQKIRIIAEPLGDVKKPIPVMFSGVAIFTARPDWFPEGDREIEYEGSKPRNFVSK